MPYQNEVIGIYRIFNRVTGRQYVGQSRRMKKRIADHFNLLRRGTHPNVHLQRSFKKHGEAAFGYEFVVECEDPSDLNEIEAAAIRGELYFDERRGLYNIALEPVKAMAGRRHSDETRRKISQSKRNGTWKPDGAYRTRLREAQLKRLLADPEYVRRVRFVLSNPQMTYAERGRRAGTDTSGARKIYIKYNQPHYRQTFGVPNG